MGKTARKIEYYDLRAEALDGNLPARIGRREDADRITRVIGRRMNNNVLIVGSAGSGKTTLAHGWVRSASRLDRYGHLEFVQFTADHLATLDTNEGFANAEESLASLPESVLVIDDFGRALHNRGGLAAEAAALYGPVLADPSVRVIAACEPHEYAWLEREQPAFVGRFETITLKAQTPMEYVRILQAALAQLNETHRIFVPTPSMQAIVAHAERYPALGTMPRAGISLLDECLSLVAAHGKRSLEPETVTEVVASKLGLPKAQAGTGERASLASLESDLNARIIGQEAPIARIAQTLARAKLGLRNPNRPLGSFLMLGPSGVGKTETAKLVAETLFGRSEAFLRIDMSEFQQDHTIQRLIGAPAGYVGYEAGGSLTNALRREPHSLVLLDEIEKAHPRVFDIFLQVLDDGRLTSGQNEAVDARSSVVMATSNVGVDRILAGINAGADVSSDAFLEEELMPALAETFRLEFLNRFDSILVFNPLTFESLMRIAELEVRKTEARLARHKVRFELDPAEMEARIRKACDPRFGARPVKRLIEETCESLLAESLLADTVGDPGRQTLRAK